MADMKPWGVDQTTGQERLIESTDSAVDNLGDQIEIPTMPDSGVVIIQGVILN